MSEHNGTPQTFLDISTNPIQDQLGEPEKSSLKQTLEEIKIIKDWDGQVLFLFGKQQIGKSSILGSLLHYMSTGQSGGQVKPMNIIPEGYAFYNKSIQAISSQKLPGRTLSAKPINACIEFSPTKTELPPLRLVVLEMSGEDLKQVQTPTGMMGDFREDIKLYLNEESLNIGFVLVTSHEDAHEDDNLMADFINYLLNYNNNFSMNRILLLMSKWDTYRGTKDLESFVKERMPLTFGALVTRSGGLGTYSVGIVRDVVDTPTITKLNTEAPKKLLRWIYKRFKGHDLYKQTWWQRFLSKIQ